MNEARETRSMYERLSTGIKAGALVVLLGSIALAAHHNELAPAEMRAIETTSQAAPPSNASSAHYLPSQFQAPIADGAATEAPPTF